MQLLKGSFGKPRHSGKGSTLWIDKDTAIADNCRGYTWVGSRLERLQTSARDTAHSNLRNIELAVKRAFWALF